MTNNQGMHGEEQHMGNHGLLWECLDRFLNKKITFFSDLEARTETTDDFGRFMINYSHVLTEKTFF